MERSGTRPAPTVELDELRELLARQGPFTSVYLPLERKVDNAASRNELVWHAVRDSLVEAPDSAIDSIEAIVPEAHHFGDGLGVVCSGAEPCIVEVIDPVPTADGAGRVDAVPWLAPLVASRQRIAPHVIAMVDRRGADLVGVPAEGAEIVVEIDVTDPDRPERKVGPGGWSQRRFQQRVENAWEDGAGAVAEELHALADRIGARLVVLGGDDRTLSLLEDALPSSTAEIFRLAHETRAAGSESDLDDQVRRFVHDVTARDTVALLEKFREERGQHDRAVEGTEGTIAALQRAQVDVLLVHDDPADERRAFFGDEPGLVAPDRPTLEDLGARNTRDGRLVDVAIRSALLTGADVHVVPKAAGPKEGLGAILRYS